jgi:acetyl-CoA acetyltransferase
LDRAKVSRDEVGLLFLYDSFTFTVVSQLEELGFCARGEGGPFAAEMLRSADGPSKLNPHGGMLSEGYVHSMNNAAAAVRELRGEGCLGPGAGEVALVTGVSLGRGSALVLERSR